MSILVQFRVRVPDVDRFVATWKEGVPLAAEDGASNQALYSAESDPNELSMFAEWDSHDTMHGSMEKRGDEFQEKAGTEGLDWETFIWHELKGGPAVHASDPSVLVQFRVDVPDVDRFLAAIDKWQSSFDADGGRNGRLFALESNPNSLGWLQEWDSHDAMMESSEKTGEPFQADAGTEGMDWETRILHRIA